MIKGLGLAVVISTVAMGCGGGGGGSGFSTSVPPGTPLNKLSASDATKLCMDTGTFVNAQVKADLGNKAFECRVASDDVALNSATATTTDAMLQQACQEFYQTCLTTPIPADAGVGDFEDTSSTDCSTAPTDVASCTATVAQYSACVSETVTDIQIIFPACNQLTTTSLSVDAGASATGPACTTFYALCPSFADSSSMMGSTMSPLRAAQ
jgi:hypothetical protein